MINSVKFTESFSDSFNLVVQVTKDVNFGENHWNFSEMCYYYDCTRNLFRKWNLSENSFWSENDNFWIILSKIRIKKNTFYCEFQKLLWVSFFKNSLILWSSASFILLTTRILCEKFTTTVSYNLVYQIDSSNLENSYPGVHDPNMC